MASCIFCSRYSSRFVGTTCATHCDGKSKRSRPDYMQIDMDFGPKTTPSGYPQNALTTHYLELAKNVGWCDYNVITDLILNEEITYKGKTGQLLELMVKYPELAAQVGSFLDEIRFTMIVQQMTFQ